MMFSINTVAQYDVQFGAASDKAMEEISVDQSQNVIEYHVTETSPLRDNSQVWAVSDFNRVSVKVFALDWILDLLWKATSTQIGIFNLLTYKPTLTYLSTLVHPVTCVLGDPDSQYKISTKFAEFKIFW